MMLNLIPLPYRILAGVVQVFALFTGGFAAGARMTGDHWLAKVAEAERKATAIEQKQSETTVQVVTEYVDRVQTVRVAGETIVKEVAVYVTPEADAACVLHRGFVRLHDAAAANQVPDAPGTTDAAPAGIALSTAAGTITDNYERCHENAEQLTALQLWISEMTAATQATAH